MRLLHPMDFWPNVVNEPESNSCFTDEFCTKINKKNYRPHTVKYIQDGLSKK